MVLVAMEKNCTTRNPIWAIPHLRVKCKPLWCLCIWVFIAVTYFEIKKFIWIRFVLLCQHLRSQLVWVLKLGGGSNLSRSILPTPLKLHVFRELQGLAAVKGLSLFIYLYSGHDNYIFWLPSLIKRTVDLSALRFPCSFISLQLFANSCIFPSS